jgi:O-antigen biosynthesis protein
VPDAVSFPDRGVPEVSVIVLGWRDAPSLFACLGSVADSVDDVAYEVLIFLNEPTDAVSDAGADKVSGARVFPFRANLGFGGGVNYAAGKARGRYLALLNDDCVVEHGWLSELLDLMERRPQCGLAGGTVLHPDGRMQGAGALLWSDASTWSAGEDDLPAGIRFEHRVDYCPAASLLIRREVWDLLGGFDDRYYPAYYEDVDLALRAAELGWESWYQPLSVVRHERSASTTRAERDLFGTVNGMRFTERWDETLRKRHISGAYEAALWHAMGEPTRVLVLGDAATSGLAELAGDPDLHVAFHPTGMDAVDERDLGRLGVRLIVDLAAHLATDGVGYDAVVLMPGAAASAAGLIAEFVPRALVLDVAHRHYLDTLTDESGMSGWHIALRERLCAKAGKHGDFT